MFAYCKDTKINARRAVKMKTKPKFSAHTHTHNYPNTATDRHSPVDRAPLKKIPTEKKQQTNTNQATASARERPLLLSLSLAPPQKHSASTAALSSLTDETGSPKAATEQQQQQQQWRCLSVCVRTCLCASTIDSKHAFFTHFAFALFFCELLKFVVVA